MARPVKIEELDREMEAAHGLSAAARQAQRRRQRARSAPRPQTPLVRQQAALPFGQARVPPKMARLFAGRNPEGKLVKKIRAVLPTGELKTPLPELPAAPLIEQEDVQLIPDEAMGVLNPPVQFLEPSVEQSESPKMGQKLNPKAEKNG